jgi:membrane protein
MLLFLGKGLPYVLTIITFTLIYILIPNTKVQFKSALYGAVIATILWKMIGALFTAFIVDSTNYTAIYSGFAIMIIFMLWIHANWLIVLTGASISYYHQNPGRISDQSQIPRLSCRLREKLALTVMQLIANSFHHNESAWTIKSLARKTKISEQALMIIIPSLLSNKLLVTTGKDDQHYLPAQSLEKITLDMILNAARSAEETTLLHPDDVSTVQQVDDTMISVGNAITGSINHKTLKDLI